MRNFLIFENIPNKDYINNIDKIYSNFKNIYIKHNNDLNNYNKNIRKEYVFFKNMSKNINNDFKTYQNNLNNTDLIKQYISIVNNTDEHYFRNINTLQFKIYLHKIDTDILIKILTTCLFTV